MPKTYGGWDEKKWIEHLKWILESPKFTKGYKAQWAFEKKRVLQSYGEWDELPSSIKINLQFYSFFAS